MRDGPNCTEPSYSWVIDTLVATTTQLRDLATHHGASAFGVTTPRPFTESLAALRDHKASGMSGSLRFTYDEPEIATDVRQSFPWARSLIVVGVSYVARAFAPAPTGALVARFATADHYTAVRAVTDEIVNQIRALGGKTEVLLDDNRLVDRAAAARSGAGWIGKSTMLLAPGEGPWMLLGTVVTDTKLDPTDPMRRGCGNCVACIPACPTGAITDRGLDATRCLSTWLQTAGSLPHWIRPMLGRRIYGCDDCLTSCPPGQPLLEKTAVEPIVLPFSELLSHSDEELLERFSWWYVPRRDPRFIRRNIVIAAGNSREPEAQGPIEAHLTHRSGLIRGHAAWALARHGGADARLRLKALQDEETIPEVLAEIEFALQMIEG